MELDPDVSTLWKVIFSDQWEKLAQKISNFLVLRADAKRFLDSESGEPVEVAFRCLLRNRLQRGGIMAPGANLLQSGENNQGLASRWYPETLVHRIESLQKLRPKIEVIAGDGMEMIAEYSDNKSAVFLLIHLI